MSPFERWTLHLAALATAGSGVLYGWLRYYGRRAGEFGPEPHPLQAIAQHLHVLVAPLLVLALGVVLKAHVEPLVRNRRLRGFGSGAALLAGLLPMVFGGYALQTVTDPGWRAGWAWVHGLSGLLFLAAYLAHLARREAAQPVPEGRPEAG